MYRTEDQFTLGARWSLGKADNGVRMRGPEANGTQRNVVFATFAGIEEAWVWGYRNRLGWPYDTSAIFGIVLAKDRHDASDRFCSEFIMECAEKGAGIQLLSTIVFPYWKVTPRDLMLSRTLEWL
jgi:hypothetical protein